MMRPQEMTLSHILNVATRIYAAIQFAMESLGWNANRYGWDWPTAAVYHPRKVARFGELKREVISRANAAGMNVIDFIQSK